MMGDSYLGRLRQIAGKPPGLYVSPANYKTAKRLSDKATFVDEELVDDDWYVVTESTSAAAETLLRRLRKQNDKRSN